MQCYYALTQASDVDVYVIAFLHSVLNSVCKVSKHSKPDSPHLPGLLWGISVVQLQGPVSSSGVPWKQKRKANFVELGLSES